MAENDITSAAIDTADTAYTGTIGCLNGSSCGRLATTPTIPIKFCTMIAAYMFLPRKYVTAVAMLGSIKNNTMLVSLNGGL